MTIYYLIILAPLLVNWLTPAQCPVVIIPEHKKVETLEGVNVASYTKYVDCKDLPELKIKSNR